MQPTLTRCRVCTASYISSRKRRTVHREWGRASDPKGWNPGFFSWPQFAHLSNGGGNNDPCLSGFSRDAVSKARKAPQTAWRVVCVLCKDGLLCAGSKMGLEGLKRNCGRGFARETVFSTLPSSRGRQPFLEAGVLFSPKSAISGRVLLQLPSLWLSLMP